MKKKIAVILLLLACAFPLRKVYTDAGIYEEKTQNFESLDRWSANEAYLARGFLYPFLYSMNDLMVQMMGGPEPKNLFQEQEDPGFGGVPLFCLTTSDKMFGASLMVRDDILANEIVA